MPHSALPPTANSRQSPQYWFAGRCRLRRSKQAGEVTSGTISSAGARPRSFSSVFAGGKISFPRNRRPSIAGRPRLRRPRMAGRQLGNPTLCRPCRAGCPAQPAVSACTSPASRLGQRTDAAACAAATWPNVAAALESRGARRLGRARAAAPRNMGPVDSSANCVLPAPARLALPRRDGSTQSSGRPWLSSRSSGAPGGRSREPADSKVIHVQVGGWGGRRGAPRRGRGVVSACPRCQYRLHGRKMHDLDRRTEC